jgi:hypothetical protein
MRQTIQMLAGCVLPLLLLFILPLLGISGGMTLFLVIVALFIGHLWMMRGHGGHEGHGGGGCGMGHGHGSPRPTPVDEESSTRSKGVTHEHHQH